MERTQLVASRRAVFAFIGCYTSLWRLKWRFRRSKLISPTISSNATSAGRQHDTSSYQQTIINVSTSRNLRLLQTIHSTITRNNKEKGKQQSQSMDNRRIEKWISLQKYHPTQLRGNNCYGTPFKRRRETPGWLVQAKRRLRSLILRLEKEPDVYNRYSQFIQEVIQLWHMEKICRNKRHMHATNSFYLPHHCVIKDTSSTTNLRVVLNASAKSADGVSLNDRLMAGPQFQKDLFWILIRFRFHQVALSADIARRYRKVQLDDEENDFHRVFWKKFKWHRPEDIQNDKSDLWNSIIFVPLN